VPVLALCASPCAYNGRAVCTHMYIRNTVVVGLRHDVPVAIAVGRHGVVQFGLTLTDGLAYATDDIARLRGLDHALDEWNGVVAGSKDGDRLQGSVNP